MNKPWGGTEGRPYMSTTHWATMSEPMIALLDTPQDARETVTALLREGVPRSAITVISAEPVHGIPEDSTRSRSHIGAFAIAGGLIGATCAILLTVITSRRVDLVTGGMPIVTHWAFGIIVFELTALGAILGTLARMIIESKLARRAPGAYDHSLCDGQIVLLLDCTDSVHRDIARKVVGPLREVDSSAPGTSQQDQPA